MESRRDLYDVIVVGAGIEGSSTAYQLAKKGKDVLLLEQFPLPHSRGSSHGQTRITRKAYGAADYYTAMMAEAFQLLHQLEAETGETLFKECGCLFMSQPSDEYISNAITALRREGIPHDVLETKERKQRYPIVTAPDDFRFLLDQSGGVLRSEKILQAYHKRFVAEGGILRDGEPMTDVIPGRVVTVKTNKGQYRGKSVVLALGPWAAKFLPKLGLELPLKPIRIAVFYWKEKVPGEFSNFPTFVETGACGNYDVYGLPTFTYPGLMKICLHSGPAIDPDQRDNVDSSWVLNLMKDYIARRFPTLEATPSITESCIYTINTRVGASSVDLRIHKRREKYDPAISHTNTPDEDFILDTHPKWKNVIIGAGFSGHGFKLSPVVGKVLAELALGQKPSYDLGHFRIDRFMKAKI